jgi:hypothetical protein
MAVGFPVKADYLTGDVLSAANMNDLSGTLNTIQSVEYAAGKNKIINGDFRFNQRAFTTTTISGTYGFDRFVLAAVDGTVTYTPQTFTAGAAPVAGYESSNFAQIVTTGQTLTTALAQLQQKIEDVRTFAGQTATFSFYAKANTGTPNIIVALTQNFGSGGSPSASVATVGTVKTITTSWARYSFTIAVPSISGKTVGTTANTSFLNVQIAVSGGSDSGTPTVGIQSNTFQIWGVQAEASTIASDFATATGTIQGELVACQRYFQVLGILSGYANSPSAIQGSIASMPMRGAPTAALTTTTPTGESPINVTAVTGTASTTGGSSSLTQFSSQFIRVTGFSGLTIGAFSFVTAGQITLSAEL